jgi:hypothetical protein
MKYRVIGTLIHTPNLKLSCASMAQRNSLVPHFEKSERCCR